MVFGTLQGLSRSSELEGYFVDKMPTRKSRPAPVWSKFTRRTLFMALPSLSELRKSSMNY